MLVISVRKLGELRRRKRKERRKERKKDVGRLLSLYRLFPPPDRRLV